MNEALVSDYMTRNPVAIRAEDKVTEAFSVLDKNEFRHLPVIDKEGKLKGILSTRDLSNLRLAIDIYGTLDENYAGADQLTIEQLMQTDIQTINVDATLKDASLLIIDSHVGALPVVAKDGELLGIISYVDILQSLVGKTLYIE